MYDQRTNGSNRKGQEGSQLGGRSPQNRLGDGR